MKITVKYWAQVKQAAGIAEEKVELETPCTVRDLVIECANEHGDPLRSYLLDDAGALHRHILLIVGDRHVSWDDPALLEDGAELTIMPPISGGAAEGGTTIE